MSIFHGLSAFPITPADEHGEVDTDGVMRLTAHLSANGVDSIGLLGSTGTYAYLSRAERRRATSAAIKAVGGKTPLIVGIGTLRTDEARYLACDAAAEGADGLLMAPVSYTPLTQEEAFQHYVAVAEATSLPLCIYNNPTTTHFSFGRNLLERLAEIPNIVAVKMPAPAEGMVTQELAELRDSPIGKFVIGYSGDWIATEALLAGCDGWFSVLGGFLPRLAKAMVTAAQEGDVSTARQYQQVLEPMWALFREFGSLRVAYAATNLLGLSAAQPPRPLLPLAASDQNRVSEALRACREIMAE
ncbi:dihydrodipicolinate synthase family protein [Acetobacter sp.]|jgi:4-hydroxy-tetrahydrodipicolinate synthase|uniref:dihydrodipicolinate synthase family protein n=1 Tax=Acetobacter sp. TaxID=440 RepID=UPI0025C62AD3|nr:dihydrodipicolinate synthase family protein [Acetobacter sp.]MCH4090762.1 dihydrodipicolinate synthase family protein [Acetobacter sp.]MCI1300522.1 dihydrodipicolinate synthase family protein [Acetobacter sp.]MCI1316276.1 dihydrodipicolinate synthase family protein [Acetobacter sp.]